MGKPIGGYMTGFLPIGPTEWAGMWRFQLSDSLTPEENNRET